MKIDNHEALRVASSGIIPILVQYRVSYTTALVPLGAAAPIVETHYRLDDVGQDNVARIPTQKWVPRVKSVLQFHRVRSPWLFDQN
jgi:hypothetical protein